MSETTLHDNREPTDGLERAQELDEHDLERLRDGSAVTARTMHEQIRRGFNRLEARPKYADFEKAVVGLLCELVDRDAQAAA